MTFAAIGAVIGLLVALSVGERKFVSETVLMFRPAAAGPDDPGASVETILNLVKVPANLEQVREKLNESTPIPALASSYEVAALKNTDLVAIRATGDTAKQAADRANALREAFLLNQAKLAAEKGERQSGVVARQLEEVKAALSLADQKRIEIGIQTGIVDLEKQTGTYLQQQASMEIFYGQALADRTAVDEQNQTLEKTAAELQKKIDKEQKMAGAQEDLTSLNIRSGRLRSSIEEDRKDRAAKAELAQKEAEFKRASDLFEQGLLSKSLLDKARAEYEAQKARATDTDQIQQWKAELARLDSGVIPTKPTDSASTGILREVMSKRLNLGLEKTAVEERVKALDASRAQIKARVEGLPELKRQLANVEREVESLEQRRRTLEDLLAKARAAGGATSADFTLVSPAIPPLFPKSSNRSLVLVAIFGLFFGAGLVLVVGVELLDTTLRSGPEVLVKAGARLLASIPRLPDDIASLPTSEDSPAFAFFRRLAYQIRRDRDDGPLRILVTTPHRGEGATFVASHLAAAFGRLDERVVYVDSRLAGVSPVDLRSLALTRDPMHGGFVLPSEIEEKILSSSREAVARARAVLSRGKSRRRPWPIHVKRPLVHVRRFVRAGANRASAGSHALYTLIASILWPAAVAETPSLAFSTPGDEGLGSYLSYQRESSREVAHPTPLMGLACLPADNVPAPLRESIAWRRMRDLVAELSGRYPVVVFDASGLLDDPDPEVLADQVDLVLVVARAEKTPVRDLKRTLNRLSSAKGRTAGVILNGVDRAFADLLTEAEA
ncbi:MAG: hypothetical protein K1Y01_20290 [Vicinamibacteria bacterium]|nr:hypothetical protein [Vicinamibacteria bacterium]